MYYVVTGAAGFIGSKLVEALNRHGVTEIIAVDNLAHADKFRNLAGCEIADYLDQAELIARLERLEGAVEAVLHQGACSDTMESDGRYMMENNYAYSRTLLEWCQEEEVPLLYASSASVYGAGSEFREERECERPLNIYGYSKFLFDQLVRRTFGTRPGAVQDPRQEPTRRVRRSAVVQGVRVLARLLGVHVRHRAAGRLFESHDHPKQRRLASPSRPEQDVEPRLRRDRDDGGEIARPTVLIDERQQARLVAGQGVEGDRYALGTDSCRDFVCPGWRFRG